MGRKRKCPKSNVISIRISDEEMEDLNRIMAKSRIGRVSDLMREAIMFFKNSPAIELQRLHDQGNQPAYGKQP
ncbi:MAG: ribbon-helix-helix protein, CopG family [Geobacter sp.]|nr:ribbon-helix-helix protein, CopG family [Geobacter sp.]